MSITFFLIMLIKGRKKAISRLEYLSWGEANSGILSGGPGGLGAMGQWDQPCQKFISDLWENFGLHSISQKSF